MTNLRSRAHGVGLEYPNYRTQVDVLFAAVHRSHADAVAIELPIEVDQVGFQLRIQIILNLALGFQLRLAVIGQRIVQLVATLAKTNALQLGVDLANGAGLQRMDLIVNTQCPIDRRLQCCPGLIAFGDDLTGLLDLQQIAIEVAPLATLDNDDILGRALVFQPVGDDPAEIRAVQVTIADFQQLAIHKLGFFRIHRQAGTMQTLGRHLFAGSDLTDQGNGRLTGYGVFRLDDVSRPEVAQTAHSDQQQQTQGHDHRDGDRACIHPDPGAARFEPGCEVALFHCLESCGQREAYFLRRR